MNFDTILEKFNFLFDECNDVKKDFDLVLENIDLSNDREIYVKISTDYIEKQLIDAAPVTILTNVGLLSIFESYKSIDGYMRIHQFQLNYFMAFVIKYCTMKYTYRQVDSPEDIKKLLKAIMIYDFCMEHKLHENNLEANVINSRYRLNRIVGFSEEKLEVLREFCDYYDQNTENINLSLRSVIDFIMELDSYLRSRLKDINGNLVYLNEYFNFFIFTNSDFQAIGEKLNIKFAHICEILDIFCCEIGDFKDMDNSEIYLDNPINKKFVIKVQPGAYLIPNINIIIENIFDIFRVISKHYSIDSSKYSTTRADYLEYKTMQLLELKFSNKGKIYANSQWEYNRHGENDSFLIFENVGIVFECKSGIVSNKTNKGISWSINKDHKKLVQEPTEQARGFASLLKENLGKKLELKVKGSNSNIIDLTKVEKIMTVGVIFEESGLQNITYNENRHIPILSIFQLIYIFSCLGKVEIIDYFAKRQLIEKNIICRADEYDFLYNYLINGLNISEKIYVKSEEKEMVFFQYKEGLLTNKDLAREKWFQKIIDYVVDGMDEKWFDKNISLLEISPVVQKQIERDIFFQKSMILRDNIEFRDKIIIIHLLEYFDSDTRSEIITEMNNYCDFSNVLSISFTKDYKHIIVEILRNNTGTIYED